MTVGMTPLLRNYSSNKLENNSSCIGPIPPEEEKYQKREGSPSHLANLFIIIIILFSYQARLDGNTGEEA